MSATPEQLARVQDPTTSAIELQSLAAVEPELWAAIAAHPNVYPDLIAWMRENGLPAPVESAPTAVLPPAMPQVAAPQPTTPVERAPNPLLAWVIRRARLLIVAGAALVAAVLAVVLVMTLVVAPQQRAAEEAAAALEQAIADFDNSVVACERANDALTSSLAAADEQLAVDPGTLEDASMITVLQGEVDSVSPTEPCAIPERADGAADIQDQAVKVGADAERVELATAALSGAVDGVLESIAAKTRAAADAAAELERQQQAAALAARTWTMTDANGYSFTATLDAGAPTTSGTYGDYSLGDACSFDPSTDVAIPVTMRVTATTQGFETDISALVSLSKTGSSQPHEITIEAYYSSGPDCKSPTTGSLILNGVHWEEPFATGASGSHQFVVIIRDWKTPATPEGDSGFLNVLRLSVAGGQNSGYTSADRKSLTLSNEVR